MPLPMPSRPDRSAASSSVRIATLSRKSPSGASQPSAPVYRPRGAASSSPMICIARIFGAPVIEPQGNSAANTSPKVRPAALAEISETICQTVG